MRRSFPPSINHRLMTTTRWTASLLLGVFVQLCAIGRAQPTAAIDAQPWPLVHENLAPAQEWVWGRLDNGVRYVVRKSSLPPGHVSLRLCVQVGFAHESRSDRGLAHFVEHMGFNGTTHFPGETLVPELRKRGVAIGPELSAFTFLTHTIYNLDGPSTTPEALDRWFTVLGDFAGGMQFDPKEVKRERGVIASEIRDHQSPNWRADVARRGFLYPGSPLSNDLVGELT